VRCGREQLRQLPLSRRQTLTRIHETWSEVCLHVEEAIESLRMIIAHLCWDFIRCSFWDGCIAGCGHIWVERNTKKYYEGCIEGIRDGIVAQIDLIEWVVDDLCWIESRRRVWVQRRSAEMTGLR
jgi:hypothetical protein